MIEVIGGVAGGLGIFFVGMWLLTENLKALATRRLRLIASRWTGNPTTAFAWGAVAGAITQSMSALTFIMVSILRSGLISTKGGFAVILGANIGITLLVFVVTFDIKLVSLYVLGAASVVMVSERASRYRPVAASLFGGAMIVLGLVLLKDSAAPLADQPWFGEMIEETSGSLLFAFVIAALLTAVVQSSSAVCVLGISLATLGIITVDQTILIVYGSCLGSGLIQYLLSANLRSSSRQIAMYQVGVNVLFCALFVPLLFIEVYFDVPLVKALIFSIDLSLGQQLALFFVLPAIICSLIMLVALDPSVRIFEILWPASVAEELSRTKYIHDHASTDVETSLALVDLEQRRVLETLSGYIDAARHGTALEPIFKANGQLLAEIHDFLADLGEHQPMHSMELRTSMLTRQKLLCWLADLLQIMCEGLQMLPDTPSSNNLRTSICEGVDAVLLSLILSLETGDEDFWMYTKELASCRSELMRKVRKEYWEKEPSLDTVPQVQVITITNAVEQFFFLLSKLVQEIDAFATLSTQFLLAKHVHLPTQGNSPRPAS